MNYIVFRKALIVSLSCKVPPLWQIGLMFYSITEPLNCLNAFEQSHALFQTVFRVQFTFQTFPNLDFHKNAQRLISKQSL